jgi:hypothetical protein
VSNSGPVHAAAIASLHSATQTVLSIRVSTHTTQGKPSDKAIPLGSSGILVTCEAGREFKAFDEVVRLLEEVRGLMNEWTECV